MVKIAGRFELQDYQQAVGLHAQNSRLGTWIIYVVVGIIALATFINFVQAIRGAVDWLFVLVPAFFLVVFATLKLVLLPQQIARIFKQQKDLSYPFEMELTEEGLSSRNELSAGRIPWRNFVKWNEDSAIFVLYRSDVMFNMLPKRLFKDESEIEYVRDIFIKNAIQNVAKKRISSTSVFVWIIIIVILIALFVNFFKPT